MHVLVTERSGRVADQGHVITQLLGEAAGGINAGVGEQTDGNDMRDATLLEMKIEIRIGEAALGPVLFDNDVASLRHEVGVPLAAPASLCEGMPLLQRAPAWVRMIPVFVIARLPSPGCQQLSPPSGWSPDGRAD